MVPILVDEDFRRPILKGLRRLYPEFDSVSVRELGFEGKPDSFLLEYAAGQRRVVLTHDVNTMVAEAYDRVRSGLPMSGVFLVQQFTSIQLAIEEIALPSLGLEWSDCENMVFFIPLQ